MRSPQVVFSAREKINWETGEGCHSFLQDLGSGGAEVFE